MAWNLDRILSVGRQVVRAVQQVQRGTRRGTSGRAGQGPLQRAPRQGTTTAPARPHRVPPARGVTPWGEVLDYPGDFRGRSTVRYAPVPGAEAGPGEVVWTWVPFEELDGRGKDRPVLIVGRHGPYLLAAPLTTRDRNNATEQDRDYLDIGSGPWDTAGRPSEVKLDRILQVNPRDVRREGGVLDQPIFDRVATRLRRAHGWT